MLELSSLDEHGDLSLVGVLLLLLTGVTVSVAVGLLPVRRLCSPADALYWSSWLPAIHGIDNFAKSVKDWALRELSADGQRSLAVAQHHLPSDAALDVALGSEALRTALDACTTGIHRFEGPLNDGLLPAASCAILECLHLQACRVLAAGATGEAVEHFFLADAARSARSNGMPDEAVAKLLIRLRGDAAARLVILGKVPALANPALAKLIRGTLAEIIVLRDEDPAAAGLLMRLAKALSLTGSSCADIPAGMCAEMVCASSNCGQVVVPQRKIRRY
jgi:hypothetical protein